MLQWFRARAAAIAPILLLSLAALTLPHASDSAHDADGNFAIVFAHDAAGHAVGRPSAAEEPPDHCAICHFSRPFRPLTQITFIAAAALQSSARILHDIHAVAKTDLSAQPPLRAPPLSPDSV